LSFGISAYSEAPFASLAFIPVNVTVDLSGTSVVATTAIGTVSVQGSVSVVPSSMVLNTAVGTLTFEGNAVVDLSGVGVVANTAIGTATVEGDATFVASGLALSTAIATTVTVQGNAVVTFATEGVAYGSANYGDATSLYQTDLAPLKLTTAIASFTVVGNAVVDLSSVGFVATTALSTSVSVVGNANIISNSVVLTTALSDQVSVVGNANVAISSFDTLNLGFISDITVFTIRRDDYSKDRVIFIPSRNHIINNNNNIGEQNRTIIIPPRRHIVSKTKIAA
tara:strand:- start:4025 stop:4870 length:846 start_codon:yes stop_codon:yes gene_type:complete